ncbi:protein FAM241B-like isoform X2 [Rhincodon typus]|uniref:protein FAM241B-like isoform X2 n=1 Tax=Rhincodon typus TaxID=259920 RepID=UPI002030C1E3|nr:protein FAM241B-like isoform X2 [Rhincodon typus]
MVRILANGEIVQNDDPRVRTAPQRREDLNRPRQGYVHNSENANQFYHGQTNQDHSLFANLNQQLINMGFPRWNLGNQVIEPLVSVLLILLLMMFGMRGLLLIGGLYLFSRFYSAVIQIESIVERKTHWSIIWSQNQQTCNVLSYCLGLEAYKG